LEENETEVKVAYMRENGDKVGAIEEAVRHVDTDNVVLTDADTRLKTPDNISGAEEYIEDNELGALAFKVVPDDSSEGIIESAWNRLQDFEYAMGRAQADNTTGEKLRLDPSDKNVRCIAGAGGMYVTEVIEEALEHHSGRHAGDDMEATGITQLILDQDVDYLSDVEFETDVPKEYLKLKDQRVRWNRGAIQALSQHPDEYLGEVLPDLQGMKEARSVGEFTGALVPSRYGQTIAYEAGITAAASVFLGKAAFEASQGDYAQVTDTLGWFAMSETIFSGTMGSYAAAKGELKDGWTIPALTAMPLYRAATLFPGKIGSQKQALDEKLNEAEEEFAEGLEEGNSDFNKMRKLGRAVGKAEEMLSWRDSEEKIDEMLEEK